MCPRQTRHRSQSPFRRDETTPGDPTSLRLVGEGACGCSHCTSRLWGHVPASLYPRGCPGPGHRKVWPWCWAPRSVDKLAGEERESTGRWGRKRRIKGRETEQQGPWLSRKPGGPAEPGEARGGEEEAREAGEGKAARALRRGCTAPGEPGEPAAAGPHLPSGARTQPLPVRPAGGSTRVFLHGPPPAPRAARPGPMGLGLDSGQRSGPQGLGRLWAAWGGLQLSPCQAPEARNSRVPPAHPGGPPSLQMGCP